MPRPKSTVPRGAFRSTFFGISAETIADWLDCSLAHALALKAGRVNPSASALKLFKLFVDGRVLGDQWQGWAVHQDKLYDPEGHQTSQPQLRAWPFIYQLAHEYGRQNPAAKAELSRLITLQLSQAAASHGQAKSQPGRRQKPKLDAATSPSPNLPEKPLLPSRLGAAARWAPCDSEAEGRPSGASKGKLHKKRVITAGYEKAVSHS